MNDFKQIAILKLLRQSYNVDLVCKPRLEKKSVYYLLKIKIEDSFIYCGREIFKDEDVLSSLRALIDKEILDFYMVLKERLNDRSYFFKQVSLMASFEHRESPFVSDKSSAFAYEVFERNSNDVIMSLQELERTTLDPYLYQFKH